MKKFSFLAVAMAAVAFTSCNNGVGNTEIKADADSLAYEFGVANSGSLKDIAAMQFGVDSAYLDAFIEGMKEVDRLDFSKDIRLYSQTTKSLDEFRQIVEYIQAHISPDATFEYHDTICRQVANRMPNIQKFAASHDLVFFVCGRKSSNGKILYHECKKVNENSYLIDQPEEIDKNLLEGVQSIGICGATSTPKWLMEECKKKILNN
mgnify:CR=1 FL=1